MGTTIIDTQRGESAAPGRGTRRDERGFILVLAILIMFILTLLGTTSILNSTIDNKIADNDYKGNQALYAADGAVQAAMAVLNAGTLPASTPGAYPGGQGLPLPNDSKLPVYDPTLIDPGWRYPSNAAQYIDSAVDGDLKLRNQVQSRWYLKWKTDDTGDVVYYNKSFGYVDAFFNGGDSNSDGVLNNDDDHGYPVVQIVGQGILTTDETWSTDPNKILSERKVIIEVGRQPFDVKVEGALTANSNVELTGNLTVDGEGHDLSGKPCTDPAASCSCDTSYPDVFVDSGMAVTNGGSASNEEGGLVTTTNDGTVTMPRYPWDVLGIDKAGFESYFEMEIPTGNSYDLPATGNHWVAGMKDTDADGVLEPITAAAGLNIDMNANTNGILMVHNPEFDPIVWAASDPTSGTYDSTHTPNADGWNAWSDPTCTGALPVYCVDGAGVPEAYNPEAAPAIFTLSSNRTFKGVIIADTVVKLSGTPNIMGAIVSLSNLGVQNTGTGSPTIVYSCDAINQFVQVGFGIKLLWKKM